MFKNNFKILQNTSMEIVHESSICDHRCKDTYPTDIAQFIFKSTDRSTSLRTCPLFSCTLELFSTKPGVFIRSRQTVQLETKTLIFHIFPDRREVLLSNRDAPLKLRKYCKQYALKNKRTQIISAP